MTVDDGDGSVRTLTRVISVAGLPVAANIVLPQPTAVEGQKVRARATEALLNRTETLSFVWSLTKTPTGIGSVPTAYPFTIPSPGVIEFVPNDDGKYTIGLTVFQAGATTGGVVAPPQIVNVTNASPRVYQRAEQLICKDGPNDSMAGGFEAKSLFMLASSGFSLASEHGSDGQRSKQIQRAMSSIKKAIDSGFRDFIYLARDPDFSPLQLRDDFQQLISTLK